MVQWLGLSGFFHCYDPGSITDWETKIVQVMQHSQKKKKKIDTENRVVVTRGKKKEREIGKEG